MALLSSDSDRGENTDFGLIVTDEKDVHAVGEMDPGEPSNMRFFVAFELTQAAPQSFRLKDFAPINIPVMSVTLDTSHFEISLLNDFAQRNIRAMSVTLDTSHFEMSLLNDVAALNMLLIVVTLDTSHLEMSPSKRAV